MRSSGRQPASTTPGMSSIGMKLWPSSNTVNPGYTFFDRSAPSRALTACNYNNSVRIEYF